ncbi:MAG: hypothetical protein ACRCYZ_06640 [Alphaproteobacteria bacterium]
MSNTQTQPKALTRGQRTKAGRRAAAERRRQEAKQQQQEAKTRRLAKKADTDWSKVERINNAKADRLAQHIGYNPLAIGAMAAEPDSWRTFFTGW